MIHTTHGKAIEVYKILENIRNEPFRIEDSRALMLLQTKLDIEAKFHDTKVREILDHYHPQYVDGSYQFATAEDKESFEKAFNELQSLEIDLDVEPVIISVGKYVGQINGIFISLSNLKMLDGFVEAVE